MTHQTLLPGQHVDTEPIDLLKSSILFLRISATTPSGCRAGATRADAPVVAETNIGPEIPTPLRGMDVSVTPITREPPVSERGPQGMTRRTPVDWTQMRGGPGRDQPGFHA